ncbi:MAG: hypothetical protein C0608_10535 [Deltaproteobacteria bacterium]|nr:MAG: hypothetical protein C0608_10535 [Deltaproteobacteria bacterium]
MPRKLSICIAQINYSSPSIGEHLERIKGIINRNKEADLIVFPELILHGHPSQESPEGLLYRKAKVVYGGISTKLYSFIREKNARVIFGQIQRKGDDIYNVATYVDRNSVQHYVKTHVHWTEHFTPGNRLKVFETPFGQIGINICFDSAFSEVWRNIALKGPEIIVNISAVPAHFPSSYVHRRMAGAALDNQVFVIFANRAAPAFGGKSSIFNPKGERILSFGTSEVIRTANIDLDEVCAWRKEEAVWKNRRPGLYRKSAQRNLIEPLNSTKINSC